MRSSRSPGHRPPCRSPSRPTRPPARRSSRATASTPSSALPPAEAPSCRPRRRNPLRPSPSTPTPPTARPTTAAPTSFARVLTGTPIATRQSTSVAPQADRPDDRLAPALTRRPRLRRRPRVRDVGAGQRLLLALDRDGRRGCRGRAQGPAVRRGGRERRSRHGDSRQVVGALLGRGAEGALRHPRLQLHGRHGADPLAVPVRGADQLRIRRAHRALPWLLEPPHGRRLHARKRRRDLRHRRRRGDHLAGRSVGLRQPRDHHAPAQRPHGHHALRAHAARLDPARRWATWSRSATSSGWSDRPARRPARTCTSRSPSTASNVDPFAWLKANAS